MIFEMAENGEIKKTSCEAVSQSLIQRDRASGMYGMASIYQLSPIADCSPPFHPISPRNAPLNCCLRSRRSQVSRGHFHIARTPRAQARAHPTSSSEDHLGTPPCHLRHQPHRTLVLATKCAFKASKSTIGLGFLLLQKISESSSSSSPPPSLSSLPSCLPFFLCFHQQRKCGQWRMPRGGFVYS